MPDIDVIERLLCQRYNVQAIDAGELTSALALARGGDTRALRAALDARELYRWRAGIYGALGDEQPEPEPEADAIEPVQPVAEESTEGDEEPESIEAPRPFRRGRRN